MKAERLTKAGVIVGAGAFLLSFMIPYETEDNFPIIELAHLFLFFVFVVSALTGIISSIVARKRLLLVWRIAPYLLPVGVLSWGLLDRYYTPDVDIETVYMGANATISTEITFGFGSSARIMKWGETNSDNFGPATPTLKISWGREEKDKHKTFKIDDSIPRFGQDRIIRLTLLDDDAIIQIQKKTAQQAAAASAAAGQ